MQEVQFLQGLHTSTPRDYLARMNAEKPHCMRVAKKYGYDYWDGDRKFGYGGMRNDGRWKPIAEAMIKHYGLDKLSGIDKHKQRILDIGCGKGYLLSELAKAPAIVDTRGIDISSYAVKESANAGILKRNCVSLPYEDSYFHFVYSINVLHNLDYYDLRFALKEMRRVRRIASATYICVESYRNEEELCNLQCWALTCKSFYSPDDWKNILSDNGYNGDIEFIYFT